jgi:hypothetical protein
MDEHSLWIENILFDETYILWLEHSLLLEHSLWLKQILLIEQIYC